MCGFTGFINNIPHSEDVMDKMLARIHHRGPDDTNKYVDENIILGFTRLSIIDLEGGNQPIFNEDKSLVLVFNGEIYNYEKIREELVSKGHEFYTHSDSEVLIHSYEEYGVDMLKKLRGMFAFVIYDKVNNKLFGARDHFGIKPFYYYHQNATFLFGSEIKSFVEHPDFLKEFNPNVLSDFLSFGFNPHVETFFKNVFKLEPGSYFTFEKNQLSVQKYHKIQFEPNGATFEEQVDVVSTVMTDTVRHHHIADVEVGNFLSSGIDSSYLVKETSLFENLKVFSVGYEEERYSELSHVENFLKDYQAEFHSKKITPEEYFNIVPKALYHLDEPIADAASISLYFVTNLASKRLKVALSGEGADELFGGYNVYKNLYYLNIYQSTVPSFIRKSVAAIAKSLPEIKGRNFLIDGALPMEDRYIGCGGVLVNRDQQNRLLKNREWIKNPYDITKKVLKEANCKEDVSRAQYLDINLWLANDILQKADKMSMANSIEVRVPFLDVEVLKVAAKIPQEFKVNKENTKLTLRHAAIKKIRSFTANKKKLGFPVPIRDWMKESPYYEKIKQTFQSEIAQKFFNTDELVRMLDEHKSNKADHFKTIWMIYGFLVWYNVYFGKDVVGYEEITSDNKEVVSV